MMSITRLAKAGAIALAIVAASSATSFAGVPVQSATEEQRNAAGEAYGSATEAFNEGRYEQALQGFRGSYDIVASPNARLMIVASLTELGRLVEAYEEVVPAIMEAQEAAATDPKYEATVNNLVRAETELRDKIGFVVVRVEGGDAPGASLTVDGREIGRDRWGRPIAVEPGTRVVTLTGHEPREINVEAGSEASVAFTATGAPIDEPIDDDQPHPGLVESSGGDWFVDNRRTIAYVAGGVGVAGMVVFGVFGGLALSTQSDLDDVCTVDKRCPPERAGDIDNGKVYQTAANTGLVIGAVGLAVGVGLFLWDVLDDDSERADHAGRDATLRVSLGAGHFGLEGTF